MQFIDSFSSSACDLGMDSTDKSSLVHQAQPPGASGPRVASKRQALQGCLGSFSFGGSSKQNFMFFNGQLSGPGLPDDATMFRIVRVGSGSTLRHLAHSIRRGDAFYATDYTVPSMHSSPPSTIRLSGTQQDDDDDENVLATLDGPVLFASKTMFACGKNNKAIAKFRLEYSTTVHALMTSTPTADAGSEVSDWRPVPGVTAAAKINLANYVGCDDGSPGSAELTWSLCPRLSFGRASQWAPSYVMKVSVVHVGPLAAAAAVNINKWSDNGRCSFQLLTSERSAAGQLSLPQNSSHGLLNLEQQRIGNLGGSPCSSVPLSPWRAADSERSKLTTITSCWLPPLPHHSSQIGVSQQGSCDGSQLPQLPALCHFGIAEETCTRPMEGEVAPEMAKVSERILQYREELLRTQEGENGVMPTSNMLKALSALRSGISGIGGPADNDGEDSGDGDQRRGRTAKWVFGGSQEAAASTFTSSSFAIEMDAAVNNHCSWLELGDSAVGSRSSSHQRRRL